MEDKNIMRMQKIIISENQKNKLFNCFKKIINITENQKERIFLSENEDDEATQLYFDFENGNKPLEQDKIEQKGFHPTVEWVKEKYDYYNANVWDSKLPPFNDVHFSFGKKRGVLGWVKHGGYSRKPTKYKGYEIQGITWYPEDVEMHLSNEYNNQTEKSVLNTLVHEMCHIYEDIINPKYRIEALLSNKYGQDYPKHGHGKIFFEQARKLDAYGFNVQEVASAEEMQGVEINNNNYDWYIVVYFKDNQWNFNKVKKNALNLYIETIENCNVNDVPKEVYVYRYRGVNRMLASLRTVKKFNPFCFYSLKNLNSATDFEEKNIFIKKIEIKYNTRNDNFSELLYQNKDKIAQYAVNGYYKKISKGQGIFQDLIPNLNLSLKLTPKTTLKIKFAPYKNFNDVRVWKFDNSIGISNTEESILGKASNWLYDDFEWRNTHDRNYEYWKHIENIIYNLIYNAIEDFYSEKSHENNQTE